MNERNRTGLRAAAVILSLTVYGAFMLYSEFHMYALISRFLPPDARVVGIAAVAVTALTGIGLPLAIHFWVRSGLQKIAAWTFYGLHLAVVFLNLILDSALVSGAAVNDALLSVYGVYVMPGIVALYAVGWIAVWAFDGAALRAEAADELRELETDAAHQRRVTLAQAQSDALTAAFKSVDAQKAINRWAAINAPRLLAADLGLTADELGVSGENWAFWESADAGQRQNAPQLGSAAPTPLAVTPSENGQRPK